jgi:branched-subunit amino acid transport protein
MTLTDGTTIRAAPTAELVAVVTAFLITRRSRNLMHAVAVGLPVFWIVDHLLA